MESFELRDESDLPANDTQGGNEQSSRRGADGKRELHPTTEHETRGFCTASHCSQNDSLDQGGGTAQIEEAANPEHVPLVITSGSQNDTLNESQNTPPESWDRNSTLSQQSQSHPSDQTWARRLYTRYVGQGWTFEVVCIIFSLCCLLAICIILVSIDGKPLSKWRLAFSVDATLSILSSLTKSAILLATFEALSQLKWTWIKRNPKRIKDFEVFDLASRGPWGSLQLLFRTKGKSLASLGAIVVISTIPFDFFLGQATNLPDLMIVTPAAVHLARASSYHVSTGRVFLDGIESFQPDPEMQGIVQPFFSGNGTASNLRITSICGRGNCTWPPVESLAVCSSCQDVTDSLSFSCRKTLMDWTTTRYEPDNGGSNLTACGYFLQLPSEEPILMTGYGIDALNSRPAHLLDLRMIALNSSHSKPSAGSFSPRFIDSPSFLTHFISASTVGGAPGVLSNSTPTVQECALSWCVKVFNSAIHSNVLTEVVVAQDSSFTADNDTAVKVAGEDIQTVKITLKRKNTTFTVSGAASLQMSLLFGQHLPAWSVYENQTSEALFTSIRSDNALQSQVFDFNPWIAPSNVTEHLERLATAMTTAVRNTADDQQVAKGISYSTSVSFSVSWQWMSFPLIVFVLGVLFFVTTVFVCREDRALKSSLEEILSQAVTSRLLETHERSAESVA